jgi:hypothetical protein
MSRAADQAPAPDPSEQPAARDFPVDDATRPRQAAGVREFPLGDAEMLLMSEGRQVVHTLNASAWAVWDLCDGTRTVARIAEEIGALLDRPAEELQGDIARTVQQLGSLALLDAV